MRSMTVDDTTTNPTSPGSPRLVGEEDDLAGLLAPGSARSDDFRRLDGLAPDHRGREIGWRLALVLDRDLLSVNRRHLEPSHRISPLCRDD